MKRGLSCLEGARRLTTSSVQPKLNCGGGLAACPFRKSCPAKARYISGIQPSGRENGSISRELKAEFGRPAFRNARNSGGRGARCAGLRINPPETKSCLLSRRWTLRLAS